MTAGTGFGTVITFQSGLMARIRAANRPGIQRPSIDMSDGDPGSTTMKKEPGDIVDPGQLEVEMLYNPEDAARWRAAIRAPTEEVTLTYKDGHGETFDGFLTEFENEAPYDDAMTCDATIEVASDPVPF